MERVGHVVEVAQGMLVVRSTDDSFPPVGGSVINESLEPVGTVVDIIGPVDHPYIVINPVDTVDQKAVRGAKLYRR